MAELLAGAALGALIGAGAVALERGQLSLAFGCWAMLVILAVAVATVL